MEKGHISRATKHAMIPRQLPTLPHVRFYGGCDTQTCTYLLWRKQAAHNPVFYHRYATRMCSRSNPAVRSSWDNGCLILTDGPRTARNKGDCQRQSSRELALDGMVNSSEPLINVVRTNKPKALTGLSQKACGPV